jgi:hypothetical protein
VKEYSQWILFCTGDICRKSILETRFNRLLPPFLEARFVYKEPRAGMSGIRLTLLDDILAGPRGSQISATGCAIQCSLALQPELPSAGHF